MVHTVAVKCEFEVGFRHATTGKLCQPSSKGVPFSNQDRIRQRNERDGLRLSSAVPKIQWESNPHCPYGCYTIGNLYRIPLLSFCLHSLSFVTLSPTNESE